MHRKMRTYIRRETRPKFYLGKGRAEGTTKIAYMQIKMDFFVKNRINSIICYVPMFGCAQADPVCQVSHAG